MTHIRTGFTPTSPPSSTQTTTPAATPAKVDPQGWDAFQDAFVAAPGTQLDVLRNRANELGRPEVVAPIKGLHLTDGGHHSSVSNALRNYPVKDIYGELFTEEAPPKQDSGWQQFQSDFYKAPATQLELLRNRANELGRPEVMAQFAGLQLVDGGHHSIASNVMRNYPLQKAYETLFAP